MIVFVCLFLSAFKACPNGKCFTVKHAKTLLVGKTLKFTDLHSFHDKVPEYRKNNEIRLGVSRKCLDFGRMSRLQ